MFDNNIIVVKDMLAVCVLLDFCAGEGNQKKKKTSDDLLFNRDFAVI